MDVRMPDIDTIETTRRPDPRAKCVAPLPLPKVAIERAPPCWAVPAGAGTAPSLPASADADLIRQFEARVARMFVLFEAAMVAEPPVEIDALRHALHQIAGTATFFGATELGTLAGDLDDALAGGSAIATAAFLHDAHARLRRAATGA